MSTAPADPAPASPGGSGTSPPPLHAPDGESDPTAAHEGSSYYVPPGSPHLSPAAAGTPVGHAAAAGHPLPTLSPGAPRPPPRLGSESPPQLGTSTAGGDLPPPPVPAREPTYGTVAGAAANSPLGVTESELQELRQRMAKERADDAEREELRARLSALERQLEEARVPEAELQAAREKAEQLETALSDSLTHRDWSHDNYWRPRLGLMELKLLDAQKRIEFLSRERDQYFDEIFAGEEPDTKLSYRIREIEGDNIRLRRLLEHERDRARGLDALKVSRQHLEQLATLHAEQEARLTELWRDAERRLTAAAGPLAQRGAPLPPAPAAAAPGAEGAPPAAPASTEGFWCARCRLYVEAERRGAQAPTQVAPRVAERFGGELGTPFFGSVPGRPPSAAGPVHGLGLPPGSAPMRPPPEHPFLAARDSPASDAPAAAVQRARRERLAALPGASPPVRVELTGWSPSREGLVPDFVRGPAWDSAGSRPPPAQPPPAMSPQSPQSLDPGWSPAAPSPARSLPPQRRDAPPPRASPGTPPAGGSRPAACAVFSNGGWRQL